ncbi:MAG: hypothetical protein ABFD07_06290 [Methanobacterium sp.]
MKIKELIEAFDFTKKEKGQVPFRKSSIGDPHIAAIVNEISKETGVPTATIELELNESPTVKRLSEVKKYSPLLYDTLAQNAIESAAFNKIGESIKLQKMKFDTIKFDFKIFLKICELIRQEHTPPPGSPPEARGLFPLKAPGEQLRINSIRPILVPTNNPDLQQFNQVTTAAATANGDFIFDKNFMQQLLNYGVVTGVKPSGAKYISNGGVIPDEYCYIEFLILHEVFHYIFGDFKSGQRYSQYLPVAHNWASDFRSNYFLVKNGYEQLPIGLFSDDLNFDREITSSYDKLIKVVNDEMKKLPPELRQWVEDEFESDAHDDSPYVPKVGDIVTNHETGEVGKVRKVNNDGSIEVDPYDPGSAK